MLGYVLLVNYKKRVNILYFSLLSWRMQNLNQYKNSGTLKPKVECSRGCGCNRVPGLKSGCTRQKSGKLSCMALCDLTALIVEKTAEQSFAPTMDATRSVVNRDIIILN